MDAIDKTNKQQHPPSARKSKTVTRRVCTRAFRLIVRHPQEIAPHFSTPRGNELIAAWEYLECELSEIT
jgi:hypothetical protein